MGTVLSGMSQGTKLGLFILMINDLGPPGSDVWKYVDDTTLAEVVPRGGQSGIFFYFFLFLMQLYYNIHNTN